MNCRRCGARLQQGVLICPDCGTRQRHQGKWTRCAACHHRVPVELTVCPHCGRTVRPAGPRWGFWLAGALVVAVVGWWGVHRVPVSGMWQQASQFQDRLVSLVQIPDLPAVSGTPAATVQSMAAVPTSRPTLRVTALAMPSLTPVAAIQAAPVVTPTVEATATATAVPATDTEAPTATPSPTPTEPPTATPSPSPSPTEPPTATATPDTNKYYTVGVGDSLMVVGDRTGIDWRQIAQVNNITLDTMLHPGDKLLLPESSNSATPADITPTPADNTPTPAPAARSTTYTVKFGDSFAGIADQFGLTWEEVARANGMNQYTMLQPGQQLVIPAPGAPQPTDTPAPKPTDTRVPQPTFTPPGPTASPVPPAPSFPGPVLTSPSDGTPFQGGEQFIALNWKPVDGLPPGALYRVKIQYLSGGVPQERFFDVTGLSLQVPGALWNQADQPGRQYTWSVTVMQPGAGGASAIPLSQPSVTYGSAWH
jgi:LysM repeat protein